MSRRFRHFSGDVQGLLTKSRIIVVIFLCFWLYTADGGANPSSMELVKVSSYGGGFVELDSGRPYVPFGTNYYDPHTGWAPKIWRRFDTAQVREHFRVMDEMGVNCARVFLTAGSFQPTAETIEKSALAKLDALVEIAREKGIRLINKS